MSKETRPRGNFQLKFYRTGDNARTRIRGFVKCNPVVKHAARDEDDWDKTVEIAFVALLNHCIPRKDADKGPKLHRFIHSPQGTVNRKSYKVQQNSFHVDLLADVLNKSNIEGSRYCEAISCYKSNELNGKKKKIQGTINFSHSFYSDCRILEVDREVEERIYETSKRS